ncbi:MAG TPA: sulfate/molybdate ABC transporter ATP-binding protein [Methylomusa anaerophila]|uniref:Sulfate/thiosulfate import ATP-binding protein CysA n=1 Tax=Methylomusa anaerophila TaxID=1930071 RepID=A0A348ALF7_9FIRM|nr:sulfate/molybdate ABC transporter ATP-binding protein [Methylomusa anaerophila]BBB91905.1 sulfate/thiosulfate import ATP-binding protein CysA [Methylomusa anaerophila]HML88364.1 sulfate/molybdate ABC transporter ATP-binding protein [Methylomusa anaerophila]
MSIQIVNVSKQFGAFTALKDINLTVPTGELVALLGPSGSGKTTLLRIIAGLETADQGTILFNGEDTSNTNVQQRRVGFVFQHYALFRHMTVSENIAFGLNVRPRSLRPSKKEIQERVYELLSLVKLEGLANRYPAQLSGGQRQRVALARALAVQPQMLLLDEPFGALDAKVRKELRRWLRQLHDELHITSVFVTHDQEEALDVADRIVILNKGQIEQLGTPEEVYEHPKNPFVYDFLGNVNLFQGRIHKGRVTIGCIELDAPEYAHTLDTQAVSFVRPYNIEIEREPQGQEFIPARILFIRAVGPVVHLELKREDTGELVEVELGKERFGQLNLKAGENVFVKPKDLKIFIPEDYVI